VKTQQILLRAEGSIQTMKCLTFSQGLSSPFLVQDTHGSFHQPKSISIVIASVCFYTRLSDYTKMLGDRFALWRAAQSLEGHLKETHEWFHDGSSLRENQLIPQPNRLHCQQHHRAEERWDTCSHGHTCWKGPTRSVGDSAAETPIPT